MRLTNTFHFAQVPPHLWAEELDKLKANAIIAPLFWGAHETMRGSRDFSKTSRLRLEKFLLLCSEKNLTVQVNLGFPLNESEILPEWTLSLDHSSLVPEALWDEYATGYSARSLPSIFHQQFQEGFQGFLEELSTILALYAHPEGPVTAIHFDPGVFCYDWCTGTPEQFSQWLSNCFESVQAMNFLFQTNFLSFETATQKQGLRALTDKRPWLMAREYKQFRHTLLSEWILERRAEVVKRFPVLETLFLEALPKSSAINADVWVEDSFFDTTEAGAPVPLCPWGNFFPTSVQAFRLSEYIFQELRRLDFSVRSLSQLDGAFASAVKLRTIVAGKYLVKETHESMKACLDAGENFYFPFGVPQYDETMNALQWEFEKSPSTVRVEAVQYNLWRRGSGRVLVPTLLPASGERWFDSLRSRTQGLEASL
jgi:hypothetical protein